MEGREGEGEGNEHNPLFVYKIGLEGLGRGGIRGDPCCHILFCQHRKDLEGEHHFLILPHLPPPPFLPLSPPCNFPSLTILYPNAHPKRQSYSRIKNLGYTTKSINNSTLLLPQFHIYGLHLNLLVDR